MGSSLTARPLGKERKSMQKSIFLIMFSILALSCKKEDSNPIKIIETQTEIKGKTTVLITKGFIQDNKPDWPSVTMLESKVSISNPDSSIYFAMSETSPYDTFVVYSHGIVNKRIDSIGIPIADYFWGIRAYFQKGDSIDTQFNFYSEVGGYVLVDSITLEPYRLISDNDTIRINTNHYFYWKENYRIDSLRFNVYVKPNLELDYNRFSPTSMTLNYVNAVYDTSKRVAHFVVGVPKMTEEPNITLVPYSIIDFVYENSFIKVISRFFYQSYERIRPTKY